MKTYISLQLRYVIKDSDQFIKAETTKHEKRRLQTNIDYELGPILYVKYQLGNVTSKVMAQVIYPELDEVTQKAVLKQQEKELQAELDTYEKNSQS